MDPLAMIPNLVAASFGGVRIEVDLGAYGQHALSRALARLDPDFDALVPAMWVVEFTFAEEFERDRITGEVRRPVEVGHFSHEGIARGVADAFTRRLAEIAAQRAALAT